MYWHDNEEVDWIYSDEKKDDADDDKSIDLEMTDDEETKDEFIHGDKQVNDDEDEEMSNAEDDAKKVELPPISSSLSISLCFGDLFLKLSYGISLISTVKDTIDAEINLLLDIKIQYEFPHIQSRSVLTVHVLVIFEPSVLTPIPKTPSVAPATTILTPSFVSTIPPVPHQTTTQIPT
ncbi:retrovirus-related pol polyprotein from transposon TNT 1-94 [Tanacetum coccineum]